MSLHRCHPVIMVAEATTETAAAPGPAAHDRAHRGTSSPFPPGVDRPSVGWREACDQLVRVPMSGAASSLNAAAAATVVLYESARQRSAAARR